MKKILRNLLPLPSRLMIHQIRKYFWLLDPSTKPHKRFIIYGTGRSGSELLTSLLNSHPEIYCDHEIMARKSVHTVLSPQLFMEAVSRKARKKGASIYGCKLMSYQALGQKFVNKYHFLKSLSNGGWKVIHIRRNNILDIVLSLLNANQDKIWVLKKENVFQQDKLFVDPHELISKIKYFHNIFRTEEQSLEGIPHIRITYENDLLHGNWQPVMDLVFDYLEINRHAVKSNVKKKAYGSYREKIENYDEIERVLYENNFNRFLNSEKNNPYR